MIVDAHHHFWNPGRRQYPWMGDELAAIRRPFGPDDLRLQLAGNNVDRTILVQTISSIEETREFLDTASRTDFIAGVVGWVDLTDPAITEVIAGLQGATGGDQLVGIRHQVHDEPDARWLLRDDVQRGIAAVGEARLVYDLLVRTRELPAALTTIRAHPRVRFVLDHAAKPRIAQGVWDSAWEEALAPLGNEPNVTCKISGLVTEADWKSWSRDQLRPYVNRVLAWFGPDRCMFGSDWPVCLLAADYAEVIAAMREIVGVDDDVFGGTASRVYGLAGRAS